VPGLIEWATEASSAVLDPTEQVVAALRVSGHDGGSPRGRGGPLGWLVARTIARHETRWAHARESIRPAAHFESLPSRPVDLGRAGGLVALTGQRLLIWQLVDRNRTRELVYDHPLDTVAAVHDRYQTRWVVTPRPRIRAISLVYDDDTVLRMWAEERLWRRREVDAFLEALASN
jgi:hypothetical protein